MTDIVLFPDVTALAMAFTREHYPDIQVGLSADYDWDWTNTLVTITDTGGRGDYVSVWGPVYSEAVITFNVSNPDAEIASEVARYLHAIFMIWSSVRPEVSKVESVTKPVFYPNTDPYTPSYQMTLSVTVEGTQTSI